jgi:cytochrome c553
MTFITPNKPEKMRSRKTAQYKEATRKGHTAKAMAWLTVPLTVSAMAFSVMVSAQAFGASRSGVQAKIHYCEDCHGTSAQGYRGYYPIPRLAGQQTQYLRNQLRAFIDRSRPNPIMSNVAHVLRPGMIEAITAYFHRLHPPPIGGEPRRLVAAGRAIFENGVPEHNVAACAACHGPDATGHGEIPRLAGPILHHAAGRAQLDPK